MHYCLNVSCEPEGPCGVECSSAPWNQSPACTPRPVPAAYARALGITRERDNGVDFTDEESALQIQDDHFIVGDVRVTPRIGISKDIERPARFLLAGNPFVSGPKPKVTAAGCR